MVHYKKAFLLFTFCSTFVFGVHVQADPGSFELNRKSLAARLAYQDLEVLVRYYENDSAIVESFSALRPYYVGTAVAGRLLDLLYTAQTAIIEQGQEDKAADRFNDFLEFLEQGTEASSYLNMLTLLDNAQFYQSLVDYPFLVRLFLRILRTSGLSGQSSLTRLREESQRFSESSFFADNRQAVLAVIRTAFEEAQDGSPYRRIQRAIEVLESYFAENTLSLFNGIYELMSVLMGRHLPVVHRDNQAARRAREHLFDHAARFQEVLQDPQMLRSFRGQGGGGARYGAVGLGGSNMMMLNARL